jgi:hypothetical protein
MSKGKLNLNENQQFALNLFATLVVLNFALNWWDDYKKKKDDN